jgi:hypothetical protein
MIPTANAIASCVLPLYDNVAALATKAPERFENMLPSPTGRILQRTTDGGNSGMPGSKDDAEVFAS